MPQLVAMLAALVLSHTERAAARAAGIDMTGRHVRACEWCTERLPAGTHHSRKYCPDKECQRLAYNAWQRAGRPPRRRAGASTRPQHAQV